MVAFAVSLAANILTIIWLYFAWRIHKEETAGRKGRAWWYLVCAVIPLGVAYGLAAA